MRATFSRKGRICHLDHDMPFLQRDVAALRAAHAEWKR
jgi:hypothetical protein